MTNTAAATTPRRVVDGPVVADELPGRAFKRKGGRGVERSPLRRAPDRVPRQRGAARRLAAACGAGAANVFMPPLVGGGIAMATATVLILLQSESAAARPPVPAEYATAHAALAAHARMSPVPAPPAPACGPCTPESWARALLAQLGDRATPEDVRAVVAWEQAEGGHWANAASYNPLNTTQPMRGSWTINAVGVRAYQSWGDGLRATVITLENGRYGAVLTALRGGNCAPCVAEAVGASPWGTRRFAIREPDAGEDGVLASGS